MPSFEARIFTAAAQRRMLALMGTVPNELADAVQNVADDAAMIFTTYAPKGQTGALGRGIRVIGAQGRLRSGRFATGRQFAIIATARNKSFDYVGVSRFGHRVKFIRPSIDRKPQSVIDTKAPKRRYGDRSPSGARLRPALRIPYGTPMYQNVVRGVVKKRDWAESAQEAVDREVQAQARRLAHDLEMRFG